MSVEDKKQARIDNYGRYRVYADLKEANDFEVARNTGIGPSVFSDWKKGKSQPKADKLLKIADYLGIRMESLLG